MPFENNFSRANYNEKPDRFLKEKKKRVNRFTSFQGPLSVSQGARTTMEIVEANEVFRGNDDDDDDGFAFAHTKVILKDGDQYFYATVNARMSIPLPSISTLDALPIPAAHIWPSFPPSLTRAPDPLPPHCYIKRQSLVDYGYPGASSSDIAVLVLHEAHICESLRLHPHPNIARYLGCAVDGQGRITGLCPARYAKTLYDRAPEGTPLNRASCLMQIESGIRHLHSLGLVHNDINPSNIMVDADDTPAIIDYDSCQPVGAKLGSKLGTPGWTKGDAEAAEFSNDFDSLSLVRDFLYGAGVTREQMAA
jgi:serine/threonine protein kinase